MLNKTKEFIVNLENGLKIVIHKYTYRNTSGTINMSSLRFAYYIGGNKLTKFVQITFRNLAQKLNISTNKLAYFLEYDISSPIVRGALALD